MVAQKVSLDLCTWKKYNGCTNLIDLKKLNLIPPVTICIIYATTAR